MENNKTKIAIVAIVALLVVGAIGATIAYFTSETTFKNEFKTPAHESEFTEEFSSPENWLPGDEEKKEVSVKNTGEYDIAVRISYTEEWIGADGTTQLPLIQDQDGTEVRAAIINFPNKDDWGKRTEDDGVTYYYYKDILGKDESTSLFMDKVTFNKDIKQAETCTNIYTYKDGTTSTGTTPEEGKIVTSTTKRCESTGQTYAGGTYILTIKIETIQWDQYKNGWGLDEDLEDLEWSKDIVGIIKKAAVLDSIKSEFVASSTGIDFSTGSSDSNGKGIYIREGTQNDEYPIYYYRGDVDDNNIIFANFCWKIVRTTETGGIKLIYNGSPKEGICSNTGQDTVLEQTVMFGAISTKSPDYVKYIHDSNNDSQMKKVLDEWYIENIEQKGFSGYIEDAIWCNDTSIVYEDTYYTKFESYVRLYNDKSPTIDEEKTCVNKDDRYTLKSEKTNSPNPKGNQLLEYSIGLLTADEISFAGSIYQYSDNGTTIHTYLNNGLWTATMTPSRRYFYHNQDYYMISFRNSGYLYGEVGGSSNVRPSISLKRGTEIKSGNGTANNPYQIEL